MNQTATHTCKISYIFRHSVVFAVHKGQIR